jgi:trimeric autotransporter adhesin
VPVPASVSLGAPSLTIASIGGSNTLTVSVRDAAGAAVPGATVTWNSDTPGVATVTGNGTTGTITARSRGVAVVSARVGTLSASVTVFVRAAYSMGLTPTATTIRVGQTATLSASVSADEGASRNVRWSSSNGAVATISPLGVITAVSPGAVTITARAESDTTVRAEALVTVVPARSVVVTPAEIFVGRDESRPLTAQVFLDEGQSQAVTWRTNRPLIATVSDAGVVTGVSDGEATITVVSQADTTLRATARVRVVPIVRNLSVSPTAASLNIGQTRTFVARAEIDQGASDALTWSSDNAAIATVSAQGVATAIGVGSTVIRVRSVADTTREATATLTVVPRPVTLTLGTRALGLLRGAQSTVSAVVSADPGVTTAVQWTSRNTAVASVDGAGRVIAVNAGATYVIAEAVADANRRDSLLVTVVPQLAASWSADRLGGPLIEDIVSLWAPTTTLAYAVNSLGDVYRWDGTTWTRSASASQFNTRFAAVHGVAADAVTAVGAGGVIAQFDGTTWTANPFGHDGQSHRRVDAHARHRVGGRDPGDGTASHGRHVDEHHDVHHRDTPGRVRRWTTGICGGRWWHGASLRERRVGDRGRANGRDVAGRVVGHGSRGTGGHRGRLRHTAPVAGRRPDRRQRCRRYEPVRGASRGLWTHGGRR